MALRDCPECGHQVSDRAETCPSCGIKLTDQLARSQYEAELARIDLEWERERQDYMVQIRGRRFLPEKRDTLIGTVVGVAFLVAICVGVPIWIVLDEGTELLGVAGPFFGICLLVGLGGLVCLHCYLYSKASAYEDAEAAYWLSRKDAFSRYKTGARAPGGAPGDPATAEDAPVLGGFPCPACGTSRQSDLADCAECGWRRAPP